MPADALILVYVVSLLAAISGVAIYSELRRAGGLGLAVQRGPHFSGCRSCGPLVYMDDADVERSRCSQCGKMNDAIQF